jgi:YidC/Oxa1 family membrane protein insertase
MPLPLGIFSGSATDTWVTYSASSDKITVSGAETLTLVGRLADGREIKKILNFSPDSYLFDVTASVSAPAADSSKLALEWTKFMLPDSPSMLDRYEISGYVWFDGTKAHRADFGKIAVDEQPLGDVRWVTLADKYFMATLLNREGSFQGKLAHDKTLHFIRANGDPTSIHISVFAGPKDYEILTALGFDMQRNLNLGFTAIIAAPLLWLIHLFYNFLGNYGLAIVLLTIVVKLATYPLAASTYKQMKGMSDLAPELKRIRETVTDKQEQQLRIMALYKEKGVNPVGGCLPMLLQMPIFIGLYTALSLSIELRHAPFMFWIKDLSAPEKLYLMGFPVPLMVVLFTASMIIQQLLTPSNMEPAQRRMMLAMPVVFGFMFASMPAGLTLYWLTNNLISIGQQKGFQKEGVKHALMLTMGISVAVFILVYILVASSGTIS